MVDVIVKIGRLDKAASQPPLLPLPIVITSSSNQPTMPMVQPFHQILSPTTARLPKLEVTLFIRENVLGWLFQISHFFVYHQVSEEKKLSIAAFYMFGQALQWYNWMCMMTQLMTWENFVKKIEVKIRPSTFVNHEAQLFMLQKTSMVINYLSDFKCLSTRIYGLSSQSLLNCFMSGLRDNILWDVSAETPIATQGNGNGETH